MKQTNHIAIITFAAILILAVIVSRGYYPSTSTEPIQTPANIPAERITPDWQENYQQAMTVNKLDDKYLKETDYYDYSNPRVTLAINTVLMQSENPREAVKNTLTYVYDNVAYVYGESDANCFGGTASGILSLGKGQCDTQSIAVIAMLRGMGIAARPVGGCAFTKAFALIVEGPIIEKMSINTEQGTASRGGALHAWVEAWIPGEGWVPLEETRGVFQSELKGYNFNVEMYPENEDKYHLCVSTNLEYAKWCAKQ